MDILEKIDVILDEGKNILYLVRFDNGDYIAKFIPATTMVMTVKRLETQFGHSVTGTLIFDDKPSLNRYLIKNKIKLNKASDVKADEITPEV